MRSEIDGIPAAEVNQSLKIIGDIWEMSGHKILPDLD